jgi:hypothetical protein
MSGELVAALLDRGGPYFWVASTLVAALVTWAILALARWGRRGLESRRRQPKAALRRGVNRAAAGPLALRAYHAAAGGEQREAQQSGGTPPATGAWPLLLGRLQTAAARLEELAQGDSPGAPETAAAQGDPTAQSRLKGGLEGVDYLHRSDR